MKSSLGKTGAFALQFREKYLRSLHDLRFFYDDVAEIGNPETAEHAFYFVPGINGTPGQMRFLLPSLIRVYGNSVYLKSLHLPEFSARVATWEKYTVENINRKLARLREDLVNLLTKFERVTVLCSSNGFYDFAAAASTFAPNEIESRVQVGWGACAPDHISPTRWQNVFYPLNGFQHAGHHWFAYPNHNAFWLINPEASTSYAWSDRVTRSLQKFDLESRFRYFGLQWDYVSTEQLNMAVRHVVAQIRRPWSAPTEALVASNDGYWRGKPLSEIQAEIQRYVPQAQFVFKPSSHLWVVNPSNMTEIFERMKKM